jgi:hypothetical protein
MTLWLISWIIFLPGFLLSMLEWFSIRRIMCNCRTGWMAFHHLKSPWLLTIAVCYIVSDVFAVAAGKKLPFVAVVGAYYMWRWWQHSKNSRKKLAERVLGVVRQTAAGLKVMPVHGGAR